MHRLERGAKGLGRPERVDSSDRVDTAESIESVEKVDDQAAVSLDEPPRIGAGGVAHGVAAQANASAAKSAPRISTWPDWRGAARDGRVKQLPATLPATPRIVWRRPLGSPGLGGVSATTRHVFVTLRELNDTTDVFCCLDAATGEEVWRHAHPAIGQLDYGNSPRATPIVSGDAVYLQGAHGTIHCVDAATGELRWQFDMWSEFDVAPTPKWGACATPLLIDGKLIINPGAKQVSLAALDAKTGAIVWRTAGEEAGYGSFIVATLGGKRQIVGHDTNSLGGWDVATGKRLWRLAPPKPGDFNVPTPIVVGQELIVLTENNGTRRFRFDDQGRIVARPVAVYEDLKPDTQSAVVSGSRLIGAGAGLHCLDLKQGLKPAWVADEAEFHVHASLIADDRRVLALTLHGGLVLIDSQSDQPRVLGRMQLFDNDQGVYSHPALVGTRLYVRGSSEILCVELSDK